MKKISLYLFVFAQTISLLPVSTEVLERGKKVIASVYITSLLGDFVNEWKLGRAEQIRLLGSTHESDFTNHHLSRAAGAVNKHMYEGIDNLGRIARWSEKSNNKLLGSLNVMPLLIQCVEAWGNRGITTPAELTPEERRAFITHRKQMSFEERQKLRLLQKKLQSYSGITGTIRMIEGVSDIAGTVVATKGRKSLFLSQILAPVLYLFYKYRMSNLKQQIAHYVSGVLALASDISTSP